VKQRARLLISKLKQLLVDGMTPEKWAASACFGVLAAIFPVIGPVTLICIAVCWVARLNLPLVLVILYGLYPVQLALILPFTWLGSQLTGWQLPPDFGLNDIVNVSKRLGLEALQWGITAVIGWALLCLPLGFTLYPLFLRYAKRMAHSSS
jgi:uncharacterized protein (DUF2062 family)